MLTWGRQSALNLGFLLGMLRRSLQGPVWMAPWRREEDIGGMRIQTRGVASVTWGLPMVDCPRAGTTIRVYSQALNSWFYGHSHPSFWILQISYICVNKHCLGHHIWYTDTGCSCGDIEEANVREGGLSKSCPSLPWRSMHSWAGSLSWKNRPAWWHIPAVPALPL